MDSSSPKVGSREEMEERRSLDKLRRMVRGDLSPMAIERRLRERGGYVGQHQAVATLCLGMAIHARRIWCRLSPSSDPRSLPRLSHLIIGPSGSGKSFLVSRLAAYGVGPSPVPYTRIDMNGVTEAGYYGLDCTTSTIAGAISAAGGDRLVAEAATIVFCDEVDKLRSCGSPHHREIGGTYAQAAMLDLVEGQVITADRYDRGADGRNLRTTVEFDTSCLWIVAAGAFSGLEGIVAARLKGPRKLGFGVGDERPLDAALRRADVLRHVEIEDLCAFGMLPELCGRFADLVVLEPLRAADFRAMLELKTPGSPVPQWKRVAEVLGFEVRFTDRLLEAMAAAAEADGLGARSLRAVVGRACRRAMWEVPDQARSRVSHDVAPQCLLDTPALVDGSYELSWHKRTRRQIWGALAEPGEAEEGASEPGTATG